MAVNVARTSVTFWYGRRNVRITTQSGRCVVVRLIVTGKSADEGGDTTHL
jgi:hypothetical protein